VTVFGVPTSEFLGAVAVGRSPDRPTGWTLVATLVAILVATKAGATNFFARDLATNFFARDLATNFFARDLATNFFAFDPKPEGGSGDPPTAREHFLTPASPEHYFSSCSRRHSRIFEICFSRTASEAVGSKGGGKSMKKARKLL